MRDDTTTEWWSVVAVRLGQRKEGWLSGSCQAELCANDGRLCDGVMVRSTREAQKLSLPIPARAADSKFGEVIFFLFPPSVHGLSIARHCLLGDAEVAVHEEKA
jgi:hypothetical protein